MSPNNYDLKIYFQRVELLMDNLQVFKNKKYSINHISVDLDLNHGLIRNVIKCFASLSVPNYINYKRVCFACELIEKGFLKKYDVISLAKNCGFKSQQNFNYAFKSIKNITPTQYSKILKNID